MIYNCLSTIEYNTVKHKLKKHKAYAISFVACALLIIILMFLIVNRSNIRYLIPIFALLFTFCITSALLIRFSFIKIEKNYLELLEKAQLSHNQILNGKIINEYKNETSVFGKIKCFNVSVYHEEKNTILFLEQSEAPNLEINKTYKFTTYRHFILKIEELDSETLSEQKNY